MKGNVQGMAEVSQSSQFCQPFRKDSRFTTQRKADVVRNTETSVVSPKCARCKNHGFICPLKGHKGLCKWKNCTCPNCSLIIERQKIMAAEQSVLKEMAKQTRSSRGKEDLYEFASQNAPQNGKFIVKKYREELKYLRKI